MSTRLSIEEFLCNLIAGKRQIMCLYSAVERARYYRSRGSVFCFTFNLAGVGCKTFKAHDLLALECRACNLTVEQWASEVTGATPTIDQAVLLFLIARKELTCLYAQCLKAQYMRSTVRVYCYLFNNIFYPISNVNRRCLQFKSAWKLIQFFCECENQTFVPSLIWNAL